MSEELRSFFNFVKDHAALIFVERGELVPMFFVQHQDGPMAIVPCPWRDHGEKRMMIEALKRVIKMTGGAQYYAFVCEAWMAKVPAPEGAVFDASKETPPSQRADRYEAVWVVAEEKGTAFGGFFKISRDKDNKPSVGEFEEMTEPGGMIMMGPFRNILGHEVLQ